MTATDTSLTAADAVRLLAGVAANPTTLSVRQADSRFDALADVLPTTPLRVGILSSFTFDPIVPYLRLQGLRSSIRIEPFVAPYGQFEQSMIDPNSGLYSHGPDLCLVAVRLEDVCPQIYDSFNGTSRADIDSAIDDWFSRLEQSLRTFRSRSNAAVLIQNYDLPSHDAAGIASVAPGESQTDVIRAANSRLQSLAGELEKVYVLDYERLVARHGRVHWSDARTALFARIPIANRHFWPYAGFYLQYIRPLFGKAKKVLVLDADNTLWGGVSGDVGMDGIALGHDFPGNAFVLFQRRILELYHRGVVLCIASKNEPETVDQILDQHPEMVLRSEHFSAMQVNWDAKPGNLRKLADMLNLGIDSFVFIDDSPVECEMVRQALPEVLTIQLPDDPAAYPHIIESLDVFDQLTISAEDRKRGQLYKEEAGRRDLKTQVVDLESFYRQLETKMTLHVDHAPHTARASQMCNRTNQFNMNTIRYTEGDIASFMADPDQEVVTLHVSDRFGDNGVVGMAIVRYQPGIANIHAMLMSCRVLGRTIEQSFLKWIAHRAKGRGCTTLSAEYVETPKNRPFGRFYEDAGMTDSAKSEDTVVWACDLADFDTEIPPWMMIGAGNQAEESK